MKRLPTVISLVEQTAEYLRNELAAGTWRGVLPGERLLCERIGISRPTLRRALSLLERQGYVDGRPNRPRRILRRHAPAPRAKKPRIMILTRDDIRQLCAIKETKIRAVANGLEKAGFAVDSLTHPALERRSVPKFLGEFVRKNPVDFWILHGPPEPVQRWFSEHQASAIIFGTPFPGVNLPSLDVDHKAVCRHAAVSFLRAGHEHLAILIPEHPRAGDLESRDGFFEGANNAASCQVLLGSERRDEFATRLRKFLFRSCPPTALLVCHPSLALSTLTFCLSFGRKVPKDLSIVSRDYEPWMPSIFPSLSHYSYSDQAFIRRFVTLVKNAIRLDVRSPKRHCLFPRYVAGGSFGPNSD
jgi:DNA-binding LacI/PurR family transcriptional regulator